jgi:3-deoxy-manno-octulosonate cytidylyltransferase (CMP-KDO synthetase)
MSNSELRAKLANVRLVVTDVAGVLTEGHLYYGDGGESHKVFHVRDGMGMRLLMDNDIEVAVITARSGAAVAKRMSELDVPHVRQGRGNKRAAITQLIGAVGCQAEEVLYIGDDVIDIPAMEVAGIAVSVADAHPMAKAAADWITETSGGHGAFREESLMSFVVVIPSRYAASRLPGKPLREIAGRPMIAHVIDRGRESGASEVLVATDDERIASVVASQGAEAIMTSADHRSGTDRIAEVAEARRWPDDTVVVNLQGDEPCIEPELVRLVARSLQENSSAGISTVATPIRAVDELFDPNVVKVVVNSLGLARYFSRAPIPWVRGEFDGGKPDSLPSGPTFLRHIGLYGYRVGDLLRLAKAAPASVEQAESLEQLRALDMGIEISVSVIAESPGPGVDTEEDLARAEAALRK